MMETNHKQTTTSRQKRACSMCGKETILQPVGVNFLERGIEPIEKLGDMVLPKIMSYKEALIKATSVMKVCENCNYGEEVSRTEIHYWIPDIDE